MPPFIEITRAIGSVRALVAVAALTSGTTMTVHAQAWVALCPNIADDAKQIIYTADGRRSSLVITSEKPAAPCTFRALPISPDEVIWATLSTERSTNEWRLIGNFGALAPAISEVSAEAEQEHRAPTSGADTGITTRQDTWPAIHVFGIEERAAVTRQDHVVTIDCQAGSRPAGAVTPLGRLRGWSKLHVRYRSTMPLQIAVGRAGSAQDPEPLAQLRASTEEREVSFDVRPMRGDAALTVLCPNEGGRAQLFKVSTRVVSDHADVGVWVWRPVLWQKQAPELIAALSAWSARSVFITVPVEPTSGKVQDMQALSQFVALARNAGIGVWAVDGDPHAVLPQPRKEFLMRASAYEAYNAASPDHSRLAGLQYDIEPYVVPGYAQDISTWNTAWRETLLALADATTMPVEAVLPFWIAHSPHREQVLEPLAGKLSSITVMAYRGDAAAVASVAQPALSWGSSVGMPVRVALENGPIPDEELRVFRRASAGALWQIDWDGKTLLMLLKHAAANPAGAAFALSRTSPQPGRSISFLGDLKALRATAADLRTRLEAWPAFHGIVLHGVVD